MASALEWSSSKVIGIENAHVGIGVTDLLVLPKVYGLGDEVPAEPPEASSPRERLVNVLKEV